MARFPNDASRGPLLRQPDSDEFMEDYDAADEIEDDDTEDSGSKELSVGQASLPGTAATPDITSEKPPSTLETPFKPAEIPFVATEAWILNNLSSYSGDPSGHLTFLIDKKKEVDGKCGFMEKLQISTALRKLTQ